MQRSRKILLSSSSVGLALSFTPSRAAVADDVCLLEKEGVRLPGLSTVGESVALVDLDRGGNLTKAAGLISFAQNLGEPSNTGMCFKVVLK